MEKYDGLALFSGGLDSLLAIKLLEKQGLKILGLHFYSPFFGARDKVEKWQEEYGLKLLALDIGQEYLKMFLGRPKYGLGKVLNPCIDCKILMLKKAKELLTPFGAKFLVSGEVLGQRPMSQRRDTLPLIPREAGVEGILVRPLTALNLKPTEVEQSGLVQREKLLGIKGRGRKEQLALAREFGLTSIPSPAGGCLLTDLEMGKRYTSLLKYVKEPELRYFDLALWGRHFWWNNYWLIIGRNKADNDKLIKLAQDEYLLRLADYPGPIALGVYPKSWPQEILRQAASFLVHFAPKALRSEEKHLAIKVVKKEESFVLEVSKEPREVFKWQEPGWQEEVKRELIGK
ncbi:MAG: tRNA-uridine 2-sulfurtransferase [Desulfonauticus sp.]|nr:MAG: hypothetical protein XD41_1215 [Desulfonauticus sp. 38_4375]MDK2921719.1 tRNA-uridine 2-sulfurtransferase [Desulfonauticus sp.]